MSFRNVRAGKQALPVATTIPGSGRAWATETMLEGLNGRVDEPRPSRVDHAAVRGARIRVVEHRAGPRAHEQLRPLRTRLCPVTPHRTASDAPVTCARFDHADLLQRARRLVRIRAAMRRRQQQAPVGGSPNG